MAETYQEAVDYLNSFLNLEKKSSYSYQDSLKLQRVKAAAEYLQISCGQTKIIHVAGTKGKGSTSHFLAYCLASLGYRVGVFSSPHFFTFRERIKIIEYQSGVFKENLISRKQATAIIRDFREKLTFFSGEGLTYFELVTLMGFRYFKEQKIDYAVVEVGLGGRLDATNIITPCLSVITHIGYDHMHLLGNSLAQIAYEKAGIIKKKIPVVACYQRSLAAEVIRKAAKQNEAPLYVLGRDFQVKNIRMNKNHTFFDFNSDGKSLKNIKIYQKGRYQAENSALALASLFLILGNRRAAVLDIKKALSQCIFEGRFELVCLNPLVIVDVAHNQSSALAVADNLKKYFPAKKVILIFSCSTDKKPNQILSPINYQHLILTQFNQSRSYNVFELKDILTKRKAIITPNLREALKKAKGLYDKQSLILVFGSFFLAAEAKTILKKGKNKRISSKPSLLGSR